VNVFALWQDREKARNFGALLCEEAGIPGFCFHLAKSNLKFWPALVSISLPHPFHPFLSGVNTSTFFLEEMRYEVM
jgi:hypothetical protein